MTRIVYKAQFNYYLNGTRVPLATHSEIHYGYQPKAIRVKEIKDFFEAYHYIADDPLCGVRTEKTLFRKKPIIRFVAEDICEYSVNEQTFHNFKIEITTAKVKDLSLAKLKEELPAEEYFKYLADNFKKPLTNPKFYDIINSQKRKR